MPDTPDNLGRWIEEMAPLLLLGTLDEARNLAVITANICCSRLHWLRAPRIEVSLRSPKAVAPREVVGICRGVGLRHRAKIALQVPIPCATHKLLAVLAHEIAHAAADSGSKTHDRAFAEAVAKVAKAAFGITVRPNYARPGDTCLRVARQLREKLT